MIKIWKLVEDTGIHTRLKFGDATNGYPSVCEESKDGLGYFCTMEELRRLFIDWDTYRIGQAQNGQYWEKNMNEIFDQWLGRQGVE